MSALEGPVLSRTGPFLSEVRMERYEILPSGLSLRPGPFPLGSGTMALADFAASHTRPGGMVCDLGCGGGALGLLLCAGDPLCRVTGVEVDGAACAAAAENFSQPALAGRCTLVQGDLRQIRTLLRAGSFSSAISNPPFYPAAAPASPLPQRTGARSERACRLDELCAAAAWVLRDGGRFFLLHLTERLCDLVTALRAQSLEPKRLRLLRHRPGARTKLLLLEARKRGGPGLCFEPDLLLYGADGAPTKDYLRIYHMEGGA